MKAAPLLRALPRAVALGLSLIVALTAPPIASRRHRRRPPRARRSRVKSRDRPATCDGVTRW
jgi:hypothetical protein